MSLLTMCQQIAREIGIPIPTTIISNNGENERRLLAAAQTAGRVLSKGIVRNSREQVIGQHDWTALRKEYTFTTVSEDFEYALPADFERFIGDTWWNRSDTIELRLASPQRWQYLKSGNVAGIGTHMEFIKRGTQILLYPTPSSAETLAFEYLSNQWCESSGGTDQSAWAADTDVGLLDEAILGLETKWRFKRALGLPYEDEKKESDDMVLSAMGNDGGRTVIRLGGSLLDENPNLPETAYGNYGA